MNKSDDIWHFPRLTLAEKYLDLLKIGITNRITLFAPRRMGKTMFLIYDLAPLAKKRKYIPIYFSMWQEPNEPHRVIINNLEAAIGDLKSQKRALSQLFTGTVEKLKIEGNLGLGKLSTEIEFPDNPKPPSSSELTYINHLFKQLIKLAKRKRPLLLIDEVQHLGSDPKFEALSYALRTALDQYGRYCDVIFTGSSRIGLRKLFSDTKAPFYEFSDRIEFPRLNKDFIEFLSSVQYKLVHKNIDIEKAWKIFKEIDYNPAYMRSVIKIMILENNNDINNVYKRVLQTIALEHDYPTQWKELRPIDREVYVLISQGQPIYAEQTIGNISKKIGSEINKSKIQNCIRKLSRLQLITTDGQGKHLVEASGFAQWCIDQEN